MPLRWRGKEVAAKAMVAAKVGIDRTMAESAQHAKDHHPWQNVTGTAESSIRIIQFAEGPTLTMIEGKWGSVAVNYFIFLELGTSRMPARPALRPAADAVYPRLRMYIAAAYRGMVLP